MKTRVSIGIAIILLSAAVLASAAGAQGLSTNVQAVLYQWYRSLPYDGYWAHWEGSGNTPPENIAACFYPLLGPYSSADPVAVEKHMEWLKRAGVGYVLLDVWNTGSYEETPTLGSMDAAAAKGIRCGFYLEPWSDGGGLRDVTDVQAQMVYLYNTYGDHAAAGKVSRATKWGTNTAPRLIMEGFCDFIGITEAEWAGFMDSVRNTPYDVLYLGGGDYNFMDAAHWDGMNSYSPMFNPADYVSTNNAVTSRGGIWAATVSPGFDNTCAGGTLVQSRENGARYDAMWSGLRGANPEYAQIVSFNEWHESSIIEPAVPMTVTDRTYQDYGSLGPFYYLDRTAYWKNQWKSTANDNAAFMSDTIPSAMEAGETRDVTIVMMNTGDTTWTQAGEYKLGGYGDSDPFASTRHDLTALDSIAPFEVRSFTFPFTAPSTPGTYHTDWQMVHEAVRWFGDIRPYKDITVYATGGAYDAECTAVTIPDEMIKGQQYNVSVTMRNTGTATWDYPTSCALTAVGGSDRFAASPQRLLSGETVPPGASRTFTFTMNTPPVAGYYWTDWRMSSTGTGQFGREVKKIVLVTDPGGIPPVSGFQASCGNGQIALGWTNPSDWDLTRVMIRYKTGGFPVDETDGTPLIDKRSTPEAPDSYVHASLPNGVTYCYTAFAHDGLKNYSVRSEAMATTWNAPTYTVAGSPFDAGVDGWTTSVWRASTLYSYGTMAWNGSAGNPGGAMRSTGAGTTDDSDRCKREGGEISKIISTVGYQNIDVSYDLRVNSLGSARTGAGTGSCTVDHNLIDEQLTVFYSTDGGASWKEAEYLTRSALLAYTSYGTRHINLAGLPGVSGNPNFALRFRWQFNQASDYGDLDNIVVRGNVIDATQPGPVTGLTAVGGDSVAELSWTNPSDADFAGTMIRCSTTGYPASPTDGDFVVLRPGSPGSQDSFVHTGLVNWTPLYYAAFAYDCSPNFSTAAQTSATPWSDVCWVDHFPYSNGALNGNPNWSGSATSEVVVEDQQAKIVGGAGLYDAARGVAWGAGTVAVWAKIMRGSGTYVMWYLDVDDPAGLNFGRWYGSGVTARGRIGSGGYVSPVQTLTGGWDDLYMSVDFAANQTRFCFNGAEIWSYSHAGGGIADTIGRVRFQRTDNLSAAGQYIYFDDLLVGLPDTTAPTATVGAPSVSLTRTGPVTFPVNFSEPVYKFNTAADVQVNATGSAAAGTVLLTGSGAGPYTVTLSNITGDGTLGITVKAAACTDVAANGNLVSSPSTVFRVLGSDGSIAAAKELPDGSEVELAGKVLYVNQGDFAYIEEPNRTCGVRIQGAGLPAAGSSIILTGTVQSRVGPERYIQIDQIASSGPGTVGALAMNNRDMLNRPAAGLYATIWGRVKPGSITSTWFILTDGSADGIKVQCVGAPGVTEDEFVIVRGAVGVSSQLVIYRE